MKLVDARRSQPRAKPLLALTVWAICRGVAGAGLTPIQAGIWADVTQYSGLLDPSPRGSKLTRLKRARSEGGKTLDTASRYRTPDAPGPPGLKTMSPIGCGRVPRSLTTEIGICGPP